MSDASKYAQRSVYFPSKDSAVNRFIDSQDNLSMSVRLLIKAFVFNCGDVIPDIVEMEFSDLMERAKIGEDFLERTDVQELQRQERRTASAQRPAEKPKVQRKPEGTSKPKQAEAPKPKPVEASAQKPVEAKKPEPAAPATPEPEKAEEAMIEQAVQPETVGTEPEVQKSAGDEAVMNSEAASNGDVLDDMPDLFEENGTEAVQNGSHDDVLNDMPDLFGEEEDAEEEQAVRGDDPLDDMPDDIGMDGSDEDEPEGVAIQVQDAEPEVDPEPKEISVRDAYNKQLAGEEMPFDPSVMMGEFDEP